LGWCPVSRLKPGAVLQEDVRAPNGRLLLKKGRVLDKKRIMVLKSWGVTKVCIDELCGNKENKSTELNKELISSLFPSSALQDSLTQRIVFLCFKWLNNAGKQTISQFINHKKYQKISIPKKLKISPEKIVASQKKLCSFSAIYKKMMEVLNDPNSSAQNIGEVISKDTSLSAKLLRFVNSPHFGLVQKIDTVSRAIALLGLDQIKLLVKGIIIIDNFKNLPSDVINMRQFWRHSVGVALMSSIIANTKVGLSREFFFVAGLLHDIGKLVMLMAMPRVYFNIMLYGKENNLPLYEVEKEILDFTHGDVGVILAKKWYFSNSLCEPIKFHHEPLAGTFPEDIAIVYLADILTQLLLHGFGGNIYLPLINKEVLTKSEIDIDSLDLVIGTFLKQINTIETAFL